MMDTRRGALLLLALAIGAVSAELPDSVRLPAFLLFGVLALAAVLMPNKSEKRKRAE